MSVSVEQVDKLRKECAQTETELAELRRTTEQQMWLRELDAFDAHYQLYVSKRAVEYNAKVTNEKSGSGSSSNITKKKNVILKSSSKK